MKPFPDLCRDDVPTRAIRTGVLILCGLLTFVDASAQQRVPGANGTLAVSDWPRQRPGHAALPDFGEFRLLPFIDSLTVGYRFEEVDGRVKMEVALEWTLGDRGVLDGRLVDRSRLPDDLIIESIYLLARVAVDGQPVADFFLPLDTLRLGPSPSVALVDVRDIAWDALFAETDAANARETFRSGFTLRDLQILRVVFATDSRVRRKPEPEWTDDRTTVYVPNVDIWVTWGRRRRWQSPVTRITKSGRDRRDEIGRPDLVERDRPDSGYDRAEEDSDEQTNTKEPDSEQSDGRKARRKGDRDGAGIPLPRSGKNDDDDDDEEDRLLPAALAGAALVGGLAVLGGTFGYMGNADAAPIGLMAGRVVSRGGILMHVSVNRQVFGRAVGPENLVAGLTGFGDLFRSRLQPAIGLGVRVTEEGTQATRTLASVSVGFVANLNRLILHVSYDIEAEDVRFGIGVNLRAGSRNR